MSVPALVQPDTSWAPGLLVSPAGSSAVSPPHSDIQTGFLWLRSKDGRMLCLESVGKVRPWLAPHPWKLACLRQSPRGPGVSHSSPGSVQSPGMTAPHSGDLQVLVFPVDSGCQAGGQCGRPGWGSFLRGALGSPGWNVQPVGNQLMLSPSWNSGTWRGPCHAGVWVCNVRAEQKLHRATRRGQHTRSSSQRFVFIFNQDYFFCFPINLLHVSKYIRTPPLVKSGFE